MFMYVWTYMTDIYVRNKYWSVCMEIILIHINTATCFTAKHPWVKKKKKSVYTNGKMCNQQVLLSPLHHNQSLCNHSMVNLVSIYAWWYYYAKCVMKAASVTPQLAWRSKKTRTVIVLLTSRGLTSPNWSLPHRCNVTTKDAQSTIHAGRTPSDKKKKCTFKPTRNM